MNNLFEIRWHRLVWMRDEKTHTWWLGCVSSGTENNRAVNNRLPKADKQANVEPAATVAFTVMKYIWSHPLKTFRTISNYITLEFYKRYPCNKRLISFYFFTLFIHKPILKCSYSYKIDIHFIGFDIFIYGFNLFNIH